MNIAGLLSVTCIYDDDDTMEWLAYWILYKMYTDLTKGTSVPVHANGWGLSPSCQNVAADFKHILQAGKLHLTLMCHSLFRTTGKPGGYGFVQIPLFWIIVWSHIRIRVAEAVISVQTQAQTVVLSEGVTEVFLYYIIENAINWLQPRSCLWSSKRYWGLSCHSGWVDPSRGCQSGLLRWFARSVYLGFKQI